MEDVSDPPFRAVCKSNGADLMYTEFISSEGLIRDAIKSRQKLDIFENERPVGIQIFGGDEEAMALSAKIVDTVNPDLLDINFGCPVKKVVSKGAGAAVLKDIDLMVRLTKAVVNATSLPVTVKTRLGWDDAKQIKFMLSRHSVYELAANLIFIAVFAGVGEELFFRGVLQRIFIRMFKDPWAGIVLTAALFSAFHFQFFGFFPRLALGVLLGAMYWYSGSLWLPIIVHFLYDALVLVAIYLNPKYLENPEQPLINQANQVIGAVISVGLVVLILWYMKKKSQASYRETYHNDQMPKDQFSF